MDLFSVAKAAFENAYAPYSKFPVGAAVKTPSGAIYGGCNVENVSYPEGTCAEVGAVAAMIAAGESQISEVLVVAGGPDIISPCGGCRQTLAEFASPETVVILADPSGERARTTVGELLPGAFGPGHLRGPNA